MNLKNWSRFFRFWKSNICCEDSFKYFWNNTNWNVSFSIEIKCIYFLLNIWSNYFFIFNVWSLMNWNINFTFNNQMLVCFICNWFIVFIINLDYIFMYSSFINFNWFIQEYWMVNFRNWMSWNICNIS